MSDLGRRVPTDWKHVDRYPFTAQIRDELPTPRPMAIGINWYAEFDRPEKDAQGHYWVARGGASSLTRVRGGHCVCLKPRGVTDPLSWWDFYDQGSEGACVGFGCSRMMSLFNRKRYDAPWLYHEAQLVDEWEETPPEEGTSVRAGLDILRTRGHRTVRAGGPGPVALVEGIKANRWATSITDVLAVVGYQDQGFVDVLNSWGRSYPHITRMPADVAARLLAEDGEFGVPTDR
jgi:hypothetical protein